MNTHSELMNEYSLNTHSELLNINCMLNALGGIEIDSQ